MWPCQLRKRPRALQRYASNIFSFVKKTLLQNFLKWSILKKAPFIKELRGTQMISMTGCEQHFRSKPPDPSAQAIGEIAHAKKILILHVQANRPDRVKNIELLKRHIRIFQCFCFFAEMGLQVTAVSSLAFTVFAIISFSGAVPAATFKAINLYVTGTIWAGLCLVLIGLSGTYSFNSCPERVNKGEIYSKRDLGREYFHVWLEMLNCSHTCYVLDNSPESESIKNNAILKGDIDENGALNPNLVVIKLDKMMSKMQKRILEQKTLAETDLLVNLPPELLEIMLEYSITNNKDFPITNN